MKIRRFALQIFLGILGGLMLSAAVVFAQSSVPDTGAVPRSSVPDISTVARPANANELAFIQAAINGGGNRASGFGTQGFAPQGFEDQFNFPAFPAPVEISGYPNGLYNSRERTVDALIPGPVLGCITARVVWPNGGSLNLNTWCFDPLPANPPPAISLYGFRIWKGDIQGGFTRFELYNIETSGRVSKSFAIASLYSCCTSGGPTIGNISVSASSSGVFLSVNGGNFDGVSAVSVGGGLATSFSVNQGVLVVRSPFSFDEGTYTLTVCSRGMCFTRTFYFTVPSGGKG